MIVVAIKMLMLNTVGGKSMSPVDIEVLFEIFIQFYRSVSQHKYFFVLKSSNLNK